MVSDLVMINVNSESKVSIAVSKRSMSYLRGRACENLSDRVQTEQNTEGGVLEDDARAAIPRLPPRRGHEWFTACLCRFNLPVSDVSWPLQSVASLVMQIAHD
jgi:hypothetical protein